MPDTTELGTCDDCRKTIPEGEIYTAIWLHREVFQDNGIDAIHAHPLSIRCSSCSSFRGCSEGRTSDLDERLFASTTDGAS